MPNWEDMAPEYESLKAEIIEYGKQMDIFASAKVYLDLIYADIMRKPDSFAHRCLVTIVQGLQNQITLFMRQLPHQSAFFQSKNEDTFVYHDQVKPAFATRAPTLHRIATALATALKEGKSRLEIGYSNTAMYTPDAEVPATRKRKPTDTFIPTEGRHWQNFCEYVDKLQQFGTPSSELRAAAGGTPGAPWYVERRTPKNDLHDNADPDPSGARAEMKALLARMKQVAHAW
jgi:hypothetical protein